MVETDIVGEHVDLAAVAVEVPGADVDAGVDFDAEVDADADVGFDLDLDSEVEVVAEDFASVFAEMVCPAVL